MSQALLHQLRATCASMQAAIAELERAEGVAPVEIETPAPGPLNGRVARPAPAKKEDPLACPKCGAPRQARQNFGGFGGSKAQDICGRCAYEFKATD